MRELMIAEKHHDMARMQMKLDFAYAGAWSCSVAHVDRNIELGSRYFRQEHFRVPFSPAATCSVMSVASS